MRITTPILGCFVAAVIACNDGTAPAGVNVAAGRWETAGYSDYVFTAERSCYCTEEGRGPVRISVADDEIVSVSMVATGAPVNPEYWFTIEDLFEMIREQARTLPDRLDAEYDEELGYPKQFTYGTPENDAGGVITVRDVVRLTRE
jgi:hypothetical protein